VSTSVGTSPCRTADELHQASDCISPRHHSNSPGKGAHSTDDDSLTQKFTALIAYVLILLSTKSSNMASIYAVSTSPNKITTYKAVY
jgi:hypothetical protein